MAGYVAHVVELHTWGSTLPLDEQKFPRLDCESEPVVVEVTWRHDQPSFVGLTWFRTTAIRRRPVRMAIRVRLHSDGDLEHWRWVRRPRWLGGKPPGRWGTSPTKPPPRTDVPPE